MRERALNSSVRLGTGISGACLNPVCGKPIEPIPKATWRRTPRRFCSDQCKSDASILRRAAALLAPYDMVQAWEMLRALNPELKETELIHVYLPSNRREALH